MMAKIVQGSGFKGAISYVLGKYRAEVLASKGVRMGDVNAIANNFITQSKLNPITKPVAHISLDFSTQDREKLTNAKMIEIADEYMKKMGYGNTQVLIVRHTDRDHPHVHLIMNRIDFNGKRISDQNEKLRNMTVCKELTAKHGLYLSSGKENVKRYRLREPDATKYRIYDSLMKNVQLSKSWEELERRLKADGVEISFKTKGSTSQVEGVRFTANNLTFNGSKVDKQFSYSKIDYALRQNAKEECQSVPQIQYAPSHETHSVAEQMADAIGGLCDLPFESHGSDYEEEQFRKKQQRKKKHQRRI